MKKYFKVKLLSDVVLNASLATEGNMETLDYIPGSNFLGIVARNYRNIADAYDIFHSGKVSFGDAHIAMGDAMSYRMPFSLFNNKGAKVPADNIYVHSDPFIREMDKNKEQRQPAFKDLNPKQIRTGFFDPNGNYTAKPKQRFALKSRQDPEKRRSKDEAMFGMESLVRGQEFIFSVIFEEDKYLDKITEILTGTHYIGKSKTAQYGMVDIKPVNEPSVYTSKGTQEDRLVLYAESNLCFFNEYGQSTFRPTANNLGLKDGQINWGLSQIRIYSYSPWNGKRNSTSTQRDVILKGSVIVVDHSEFDELPEHVGEYSSEGLGRVIWNPDFLAHDEQGKWKMELKKWEMPKPKFIAANTPLVSQLQVIKQEQEQRKNLVSKINEFLSDEASTYARITSSQWGEVRKRAHAEKEWEVLMKKLFEVIPKKEKEKEIRKGFLVKGVGAVKMWDKGKLNEKLKTHLDNKKEYGVEYIIKLAAEMAKWKQRHDKNKK